MRYFIFLFLTLLVLLPSASAGNDEIELRDGTYILGNIIAQGEVTQLPTRTRSALFNAQQIWIDTKEGLKKINTSDIKNIRFGAQVIPTPNHSPIPTEK